MNSLALLICIFLVFASAFMSAAEIALFTLSRFQLRSMKEHARGTYRQVRKLLGDPGGLLITILVVNEVVNISLSSIITGTIARADVIDFESRFLPHWAVAGMLGTLVTAPITLLLCEISPKAIASKANQLVAAASVPLLSLVYDAFRPVRTSLKWIISAVIAVTGGRKLPSAADSGSNPEILKESDFLMMVEEGHREGAIQGSELELIRNVFELDETTAAEVATPLSTVHTITEQATLRTALSALRGRMYSRVPVVSQDKRRVLGILYAKDLLQLKLSPEMLSMGISTLMRKPLFVSPSIRLSELFRLFKQQKTHMAVLQKHPSGTSAAESMGIITMRDILDALFEDIFPEEQVE